MRGAVFDPTFTDEQSALVETADRYEVEHLVDGMGAQEVRAERCDVAVVDQPMGLQEARASALREPLERLLKKEVRDLSVRERHAARLGRLLARCRSTRELGLERGVANDDIDLALVLGREEVPRRDVLPAEAVETKLAPDDVGLERVA